MKRAFTLVEMLAATAMSALLLVTVLVVIASLGRERRAMNERAKAQVPDVSEIIRWDLVNARSMQVRSGRVMLSGYGSLDPEKLSPMNHRPVEVMYEVRRAAGKSWLVRRQIAADNLDLESAELVCCGVSALKITPVVRSDGPPSTQPTSRPTSRPVRGIELSDCVRLQIKWDDENRPPLDRMMVLR